jgi:FtsZ-interacting cell division protein ZipA
MSSAATAVIIVVAIIVIALVIALTMTARRRRLPQQFGPEYDRAVAEKDSRMQAEAELAERQRRVRSYHIQPLSAEARSRYQGEWQAIQEQFVDSPQTAVTEAYMLVTTVMRERGYPLSDEDQAAEDLSVEHASTVDHFRSAQAITREVAHGSVATEDLRQAFIHYRELFAELLGDASDSSPANGAAGRHAAADADVAAAYQAPPAAAVTDEEPVTSPYLEPDGSRRS